MGDAEEIGHAEDALCLQIGRAARAHVFLDNMLRNVHRTLLTPTPGVHLHEKISSTDRLVHDCRAMLEHSPVLPDQLQAGAAALDAASEAGRQRNRVVHDMWLRESTEHDDLPRWQGYNMAKPPKVAAPPRDLTFIENVVMQIHRAGIQIHALNSMLWGVLPFFQGSDLPGAPSATFWASVASGEFEMLDDGGFRAFSRE